MKRVISIILALVMSACIFGGCTSTEKTEAPAASTPTPTVETTPTPTPAPTKTPTPKQEDMYTWEYKFNEDDPTTISPCIVLKEGVDWRDLLEVVVPAYIDGHKVTHIAEDLLGARSEWGGRKGLCVVYDENEPDVWTDPHCAIEKITFPNTIEVFEGNTFWFGGSSIEEIVFEGTENIRQIGRYAFHPTPAETYMTEDAGGFLIINGMLINALAAEEIVLPAEVKETVNCVFASKYEDYDIVKVIRINDGCEKIGKYFTEATSEAQGGSGYLVNLTDMYIPASVQEIDPDMVWWYNINGFNIHCVQGSYADTWAQAHSWPTDKIIYDME